jgi:hypothetical protein
VKNGNEKPFEITMKKVNETYGYQYSETNMMHFLFSLLRIKGLYMFRALTSSTPILVQPTDITHEVSQLPFVQCSLLRMSK